MAQVYDIITIQNIDDEEFVFEYNRSEGNAPYAIPAGEVARYPTFLANHATKHLVNKILTKNGERTNNETRRSELMEQIVVGSESLSRQSEPTDAEALRTQVKELNAPTTLESILKKRESKKKEPKEEVGTKPTMDELPEEEEFEGLPKKEKAVTEDKAKGKPTKAELITYAEEQNLTLDVEDKDGKTLRQKLSKMKIDDMIKELDYPE